MADDVCWLEGEGDHLAEVVGESYYQNALCKICGGKTEDGHEFEITALLVLEDDNIYDAKAVRVEIDGNKVGHLSRSNARSFRKGLAKMFPGENVDRVRCPAMITGGWKRGRSEGHFGVRLDLPVEELGLE